MDRYVELLKKCGVETWFIREEGRNTVELYFIKKNLDMRRINNTVDSTISVYADVEKDGTKYRGCSDIIVDSSMKDEEIERRIMDAKYAAGFALNPFYELPAPEKSECVVKDSDLNEKSLSEIAESFCTAVYSEDNETSSFINSFELFVREIHCRMRSSQGTDVSYVKRKVSGEFVAQSKEPQDVETYQDFDFDTMALSEIKKLVKDTLALTKDRASATGMPKKGEYDVLLSDKYVPQIFAFYAERAHAAYIYPGYSNYEVGKNIQGDEVSGEYLDMDFVPSNPFNEEGIKMVERPFVKEGVIKTLHGTQRLSYYIGIPQIGTYDKLRVRVGKSAFDDMKKNCLHVVNFSDFQVDALDSSFKGEIRLAYLYDDKGNKTCLTGGSVNGNLMKSQTEFEFSKESQKLSSFEGPMAVKLKNVAVAGE
ncbi:MAG: metallopeptidase TldD-related protein [Lachnospiraceae bacterium]|nr:metallopeptidase TldD-related protein [Lachnospiraceae bacterium]